jgi:hypothetical protein
MKRRRAEFVTDEEQRLLEIEDMRLVVKFGEKRRYSDSEHEAISSRPGSTTKQCATPTQSKWFTRTSTRPTRLRQQGAISAPEPSTVP